MSSDSQVAFCSSKESFDHLRALLSYASANASNESSIYGAVSFILTIFCTSATVTAGRLKNLHLGSFPQKDLKEPTPDKKFRAPDFTVLIVQSGFHPRSAPVKFMTMGPFIWEVKASTSLEPFPLCGQKRTKTPGLLEDFLQHFPQIAAQVVYAKAKFNHKPIYVLLSVDMWFILLHFPDDLHPVTWNTRKHKLVDHVMFNRYIIVPPAPIVNEDCTALSPELLYALQLSVKDLTKVTVTPHSSFNAPEGIADRVSAQLRELHLLKKLQDLTRYAKIDNKFAWGEEDSDERSEGWSVPEETETEFEDRKHCAKAPVKTSPIQTRSKTRMTAANLRASTRRVAPDVKRRKAKDARSKTDKPGPPVGNDRPEGGESSIAK